MHIVNNGYDTGQGSIGPVEGANLSIRLPQVYTPATVFVPGVELYRIKVAVDGNAYRVWLDRLSVYTIVLLHAERTPHTD